MKYGQAILVKAKEELKKGLTDIQLAQALGVGRSTIDEWKKKYPEFSDIIRQGKDRAIDNVVNAVYNRAIGMTVKEVHTIKKMDKDGEPIEEVKEIQKELPPDFQSSSFFLRNKDPDNWRDRSENVMAMVTKEDLKKSVADINAIIDGPPEKKNGKKK